MTWGSVCSSHEQSLVPAPLGTVCPSRPAAPPPSSTGVCVCAALVYTCTGPAHLNECSPGTRHLAYFTLSSGRACRTVSPPASTAPPACQLHGAGVFPTISRSYPTKRQGLPSGQVQREWGQVSTRASATVPEVQVERCSDLSAIRKMHIFAYTSSPQPQAGRHQSCLRRREVARALREPHTGRVPASTASRSLTPPTWSDLPVMGKAALGHNLLTATENYFL